MMFWSIALFMFAICVMSTQAVDMPKEMRLADPDDCAAFYEFVPQKKQCSKGLAFNPKSQECDLPANVKCSCANSNPCQLLSSDTRSHWEPANCATDEKKEGDTCKLVCNTNYQLKGSEELTCTKTGWKSAVGQNQIPSCKTIEETGQDFVNTINETIGNQANLLFVLDESGSVTESNFKIEQNFVNSIIKAFPLSTDRTAGVVTFSDSADVDIPLTQTDTCAFIKKVNQIYYTAGGTDIELGLKTGYNEIQKHATHNLTAVFLVTDGLSQTDPTAIAKKLMGEGDIVFTVGVAGYDVNQLVPISSIDKYQNPLFYGVKSFEVFKSLAEYLETTYSNKTNINCN